MGSGSPPDVCPLSSSLKVLGKKAAEHLKWLPKKRSNHYRSVLKLTKTCWTAERHSSPVTPAARDSGRKRKHRSSWSLCKCAWCWWVGPCFDLNHSIKRVENFLSYPMRWLNILKWTFGHTWTEKKIQHNLWWNHILHQLFSVLLNLHCKILFILYINIYSYSEWPCSLVKLLAPTELRTNALKSMKLYLAFILIQNIFSPLIT